MSHPDHLLDQFVSLTNASRYLAEQYLARNKNNLERAIEDYYATSTPTSSSSQPKTTKKKYKLNTNADSNSGGVRTFRDLNNNDDSEDDNTNTNFFTGGEKSGLQVEDPNKRNNDRSIIDQIFQRAKEQMNQPDDRESAREENQPSLPKFTGTGFKLGNGEEPSEVIIDKSNSVNRPAKVTREITFWKQGFTVGDGPLHRYDDPRNESVLQELNRGRVPISLLDVEFGQDVDVSVFRKTEEDWTPPKRKIQGFQGHGVRLGSPVPGESPTTSPQAETPNESTTSKELPNKPAIGGEGDSLVQIRFANGKKLSHKFNSTDSLANVYEFVRNHPFTESNKPFILSHAFPVKPIDESNDITVADAKLNNSVIVQRWI